MRLDLMSDCLTVIKNAERVGKRECVAPASNQIKEVLSLMQRFGYIGEFELVDNGRGGTFRIKLLGKVNDCNVIKPRHFVAKGEYPKWESRYLPAEGFGYLIVSTSKGVMTNEEAKKTSMGGVLLAFVY